MIEKIPVSLTLTAFFFLLFLEITLLLDRQKKEGNLISLLKTIPWDTIIKIFCIWSVIIFLRKLTYYIHLNGIIQTKDALFWVDEKAKIMILCSVGVIALSIVFIKKVASKFMAPPNKSSSIRFFAPAWIFITAFLLTLLAAYKIDFEQFLRSIIITPLLLLKMVSSGKYLGLLTGLLTAYYIINRYNKIKTRNSRYKLKFLIVPGLIIIGILLLGSYKFTGDWKVKFTGTIQAAKSTRTLKDLIDAAVTIKNETDQSEMLKEIAVSVAGARDIKWASSIAESIPDNKIKESALWEIGKIGRKNKK